jgi:hypothetical protein
VFWLPYHQSAKKGKEKADETFSAKRIQSMQLGNDLMAAMTHKPPDVLYATKVGGELGDREDGFVACPSNKKWITGSESCKAKLTKELAGSVPKGASYQGLAISLLADVRNQWFTLCAFINSFYIDLKGVAMFPKEKAWKLTGQCVASILQLWGPAGPRLANWMTLVCLATRLLACGMCCNAIESFAHSKR